MNELICRLSTIWNTPGFGLLFTEFLGIILAFVIFFYLLEIPIHLTNYLLQKSLLYRQIRVSLKRTDPIDLDYLASLYDLKK